MKKESTNKDGINGYDDYEVDDSDDEVEYDYEEEEEEEESEEEAAEEDEEAAEEEEEEDYNNEYDEDEEVVAKGEGQYDEDDDVIEDNDNIHMKGEENNMGSEDDLFKVDQQAWDEQMTKKLSKKNGDFFEINTSEIFVFNGHHFVVLLLGAMDPCWYNIAEWFQTAIGSLFEATNKPVPSFIENIAEHKLRVEYSPSNEMVYRSTSQKYPVSRWSTIAKLNAVNPQQHLELILSKFTKIFKQMYSDRLGRSPGNRWMSFVSSSGKESLLNGCKKYMGATDNDVEKTVNDELIALGKKNHVYVHGCTLDKYWPDYNIKKFLEHYASASSWSDVSEITKKKCYSNYPQRRLPDWGTMNM